MQNSLLLDGIQLPVVNASGGSGVPLQFTFARRCGPTAARSPTSAPTRRDLCAYARNAAIRRAFSPGSSGFATASANPARAAILWPARKLDT